MQTETNTSGFYRKSATTYRDDDDRIAVMLMNFADGRRWWVAIRPTYRDVGDPQGYELLDDALRVARERLAA